MDKETEGRELEIRWGQEVKPTLSIEFVSNGCVLTIKAHYTEIGVVIDKFVYTYSHKEVVMGIVSDLFDRMYKEDQGEGADG